MFSGFKYRVAKNLAVMGIEQKGYIDAATSQLMRQTAYNDMNKEYGIWNKFN